MERKLIEVVMIQTLACKDEHNTRAIMDLEVAKALSCSRSSLDRLIIRTIDDPLKDKHMYK